jgi:Trk K+ transport system NAD-binding subunit
MDDVVAVHGDLTETAVLDQLDLAHCHTFIAASREVQDNILAALAAGTLPGRRPRCEA